MSIFAAVPASAPALARVVPPTRAPGRLKLIRTLARNPLEAWSEQLYETGYVISTVFGRRTVIVTDPELVRQVLVREAASFGRTPEMDRALKPALGEALLTADGPHWRWQRRIVAPAFRQDRLDSFLPVMTEAAEATSRRWSGLADGSVVEMGHEMLRTTFDIIVATMLSGGEGIDVGRVEASISTALQTSNWALLYARLGLPENFPYPGMRRTRAARDWMRALALRIVTERRAGLSAGRPRRGDLVDLLIEAEDPGGEDLTAQTGGTQGDAKGSHMADRDIADNIMTFIGAGHETTALALTWAFYALSHHPEHAARIAAEIRSVAGDGPIGSEALPKLVFTRQVVQETLRLYPSAPVIARLANRDLTIEGIEIRRGDTIVLPIYVIHRHKRLWTDPDRFDPDRFAPEQVAARHRFSYLPFGAGPRICIGLNFALNEAVVILATLLSRYELTMADDVTPTPVMKITLRPRDGMRMRVSRRA